MQVAETALSAFLLLHHHNLHHHYISTWNACLQLVAETELLARIDGVVAVRGSFHDDCDSFLLVALSTLRSPVTTFLIHLTALRTPSLEAPDLDPPPPPGP